MARRGPKGMPPEIEEYIKAHYADTRNRVLMEIPGVTLYRLQLVQKKYGLKKSPEAVEPREKSRGQGMKTKAKEYIREHWGKQNIKEMAYALRLSQSTVSTYAEELGLYKPKRVAEGPKAHVPRKHTFQPGKKYKIIQPYSKDITGEAIRSSEKGGRCKEQSDMYRYEYSTTHLHFFRNKFGRMESFQDKRIGMDIKVKEVAK